VVLVTSPISATLPAPLRGAGGREPELPRSIGISVGFNRLLEIPWGFSASLQFNKDFNRVNNNQWAHSACGLAPGTSPTPAYSSSRPTQ
jgi:hypothetical protein